MGPQGRVEPLKSLSQIRPNVKGMLCITQQSWPQFRHATHGFGVHGQYGVGEMKTEGWFFERAQLRSAPTIHQRAPLQTA